jgi:hypothetical protein
MDTLTAALDRPGCRFSGRERREPGSWLGKRSQLGFQSRKRTPHDDDNFISTCESLLRILNLPTSENGFLF